MNLEASSISIEKRLALWRLDTKIKEGISEDRDSDKIGLARFHPTLYKCDTALHLILQPTAMPLGT